MGNRSEFHSERNCYLQNWYFSRFEISHLKQYFFCSDDQTIVLPLSISDPCCGSLHFSLEVQKSEDLGECTSNYLANVANASAAASSGASPPSPDSITTSKIPYLTKASLAQIPGSIQRRKLHSNDHNKIMSLARYLSNFGFNSVMKNMTSKKFIQLKEKETQILDFFN